MRRRSRRAWGRGARAMPRGPPPPASSKAPPLPPPSPPPRSVVYKVPVLSTNCVAAATTCDLTIATLPAKAFLKAVIADLTTTYACTAVCTTATLSGTLGTSAGGTQLLASMDLDAAAAQFGDADA